MAGAPRERLPGSVDLRDRDEVRLLFLRGEGRGFLAPHQDLREGELMDYACALHVLVQGAQPFHRFFLETRGEVRRQPVGPQVERAVGLDDDGFGRLLRVGGSGKRQSSGGEKALPGESLHGSLHRGSEERESLALARCLPAKRSETGSRYSAMAPIARA